MAGVKEFLNMHFPEVPREWECEKLDHACQVLARRQAQRERLIDMRKMSLYNKRLQECVRIHRNNREMFCREELVRHRDAMDKFMATGLEGLEQTPFDYQYRRMAKNPGIRPHEYWKTPMPKDTNWQRPHALPREDVRNAPRIGFGEGHLPPDPERPVISFQHRENRELQITVHLPDKIPDNIDPELKKWAKDLREKNYGSSA